MDKRNENGRDNENGIHLREIKIGPATIALHGARVPVSFIIGFITGVFVLALLVVIGQPPALIGPLVNPAVSAKIAALPAPTSVPELTVKMINLSKGGEVICAEGDFEYHLTTGEEALISVVKSERLSKYFRWKITHVLNPSLGKFEASYKSGPEITFTALDLASDDQEGKLSTVEVCEANVEYICLPHGSRRTYLIRTMPEGEEK